MLAPAFVAIFLQLFFFKDSPIYYKTYKEKPRWILFGYLILTIFYGILMLTAAFNPESKQIFQGLGALLLTLWTLLIFFVHGQSKKGSFERAGLSLGRIKIGVLFIVGIILFFLLQAALNLIFGLGDFIGQTERIFNLPIPSNLYIPALIILFIFVAVIGAPLSGLAGVFGEEYGWRGFLQSELIKTGKLKGVILVGIIWGVWHFPIILRGVHTYPSSLLGLFLCIIFFSLWGIIQGYAVIKTGSIWVAAFMHGVVNSVYSFSLTYIVKPESKVYSFGLGIYGLICLGIIVGFFLKDPIWKSERARTS
jgi:membrane protease YdiL (CAAX protease family)